MTATSEFNQIMITFDHGIDSFNLAFNSETLTSSVLDVDLIEVEDNI